MGSTKVRTQLMSFPLNGSMSSIEPWIQKMATTKKGGGPVRLSFWLLTHLLTLADGYLGAEETSILPSEPHIAKEVLSPD